jgi:hypothetical protein
MPCARALSSAHACRRPRANVCTCPHAHMLTCSRGHMRAWYIRIAVRVRTCRLVCRCMLRHSTCSRKIVQLVTATRPHGRTATGRQGHTHISETTRNCKPANLQPCRRAQKRAAKQPKRHADSQIRMTRMTLMTRMTRMTPYTRRHADTQTRIRA